jgi:hypothetical protein
MSTDLERRVTTLENEMSGVKQLLSGARPHKDWRKSVGMSKDDPGFDEMIRLGQEIRQQEREDGS